MNLLLEKRAEPDQLQTSGESTSEVTCPCRNPDIKVSKLSFFTIVARFLDVVEAALAAGLIMAWRPFRGGCASSRLIRGLSLGTAFHFM